MRGRRGARRDLRGATRAMTDETDETDVGDVGDDPRAPVVVKICPFQSEVLVHVSRCVL